VWPGGGGAGEGEGGVSLAKPGPKTLPAAPQPRLSRRAGFLGNYHVFPETPAGERPLRRLPSAVFPRGADPEGELCQGLLSPPPFVLGMAARPSVVGPPSLTDGRGWGDAKFPTLAPWGRAEVAALASCSAPPKHGRVC
jgi:hypothetical protein